MNIEQAKDVYESLKRNEHIVASIDKEFFFRFAETVLNELERYKQLINNKNARLSEYAEDIAERDKVIDLMAKELYIEGFCKNIKCKKCEAKNFIECIKEYFYKKAEVK